MNGICASNHCDRKQKNRQQPLGGRGCLTPYYRMTLRNKSEMEDMHRAAMATFCHVTSADQKPHHELCPPGPHSWWRHRAADDGELQPLHTYTSFQGMLLLLWLSVYQCLSVLTSLSDAEGGRLKMQLKVCTLWSNQYYPKMNMSHWCQWREWWVRPYTASTAGASEPAQHSAVQLVWNLGHTCCAEVPKRTADTRGRLEKLTKWKGKEVSAGKGHEGLQSWDIVVYQMWHKSSILIFARYAFCLPAVLAELIT